jgi:hypothetical protein
MKKVKDPVITITEIAEHKDGSATYKFSYEEDFVYMVKKHLKLDKEPNKKQIKKFLLDAMKETVDKENKT